MTGETTISAVTDAANTVTGALRVAGGIAIARQFSAWGLTDAESDVGLLLLKGLSLQEIADLRETSERTVREQARAVYRKSSLAGRNALSAYFLEDLLPGSGG